MSKVVNEFVLCHELNELHKLFHEVGYFAKILKESAKIHKASEE